MHLCCSFSSTLHPVLGHNLTPVSTLPHRHRDTARLQRGGRRPRRAPLLSRSAPGSLANSSILNMTQLHTRVYGEGDACMHNLPHTRSHPPRQGIWARCTQYIGNSLVSAAWVCRTDGLTSLTRPPSCKTLWEQEIRSLKEMQSVTMRLSTPPRSPLPGVPGCRAAGGCSQARAGSGTGPAGGNPAG